MHAWRLSLPVLRRRTQAPISRHQPPFDTDFAFGAFLSRFVQKATHVNRRQVVSVRRSAAQSRPSAGEVRYREAMPVATLTSGQIQRPPCVTAWQCEGELGLAGREAAPHDAHPIDALPATALVGIRTERCRSMRIANAERVSQQRGNEMPNAGAVDATRAPERTPATTHCLSGSLRVSPHGHDEARSCRHHIARRGSITLQAPHMPRLISYAHVRGGLSLHLPPSMSASPAHAHTLRRGRT
jgi:hypothetical protein